MKVVKVYSLKPKYNRDNGLFVLDIDNLPLPSDFAIRETTAVYLTGGQAAGNHKHPRQEAYFCLDEHVELHWIDETGLTHIEHIAKAGDDPKLFVISPFVPHAVINQTDKGITLLGYADGPLENVKAVNVTIPPALP